MIFFLFQDGVQNMIPTPELEISSSSPEGLGRQGSPSSPEGQGRQRSLSSSEGQFGINFSAKDSTNVGEISLIRCLSPVHNRKLEVNIFTYFISYISRFPSFGIPRLELENPRRNTYVGHWNSNGGQILVCMRMIYYCLLPK